MRTPNRLSFCGSAFAAALAFFAFGLTGSAPARAQLDPTQLAKERCADQLTFQISQEAGGREPDSGIDSRQSRITSMSNVETGVTGNAWYRRDRFDRGRPYEYHCVFNLRTGVTTADYRWSGVAEGGNDDFRPRPPYGSGGPGHNGGPAGSAGSGGPGGPGAPGVGDVPNGRIIYSGSILNVGSDKALDVSGGSKKDSANVIQYKFVNKPNQLWDVVDTGRGRFIFVSQGSNKVLDVAGSSEANGANILQYRYNGSESQLWRIERVAGGAYQIVNIGSGKCLDVDAGRKDDGANVLQWPCVAKPNQAWRLGQ
ncbi:MAG: RICIN domain-containing protein [Thermoanaerobaculia bacterium]